MTALSLGTILSRRFSGQPVRRNSYDLTDKRADIARKIGNGTKDDRWRHYYSLEAALDQWNDHSRIKGKGTPLPHKFLKVLKALFSCIDGKTGMLDPALTQIAAKAACCKDTVVRCLAAAKKMGILHWVRRTAPTGNQPGEGPKVVQETNAYAFTFEKLVGKIGQAFRYELAKRRRTAGVTPPMPRAEAKPLPLDTEDPTAPAGSARWYVRRGLKKIAEALHEVCESDAQSDSGIKGLREKD